MAVPNDDFLYHRLHEDRKRHQNEAQEQYNDKSKSHLLGVIDKKLHTTFIGALAHFEKQFGFLWKQQNRPITAEEQELLDLLKRGGFEPEYFEDLWLDARDKILENGNNQLKALKKETKSYTISWNRFQLNLPHKDALGD